MRHWSILAAFGLGSAALSAQVPDPGEIALAASRAPAVLTLPPVAAIKAPAPDGRAATPSSPIHTNLISVASTSPASGEESLPKLLAPPPEPAPAPAIKSPISAPVAPPSAPLSTPKTAQEIVPDDGGIPDTLNSVSPKAAPDAAEKTPAYFGEVEYLRTHRDGIMAIEYLKKIANSPSLTPKDRSRTLIELADCLTQEHQQAEALCWLKIWLEMYPKRPEFGAVAFRVGTIYTQMGLPGLARDAYYLTLAHSLSDGQVQSDEDIKEYQMLTVGTLWALSTNEYQAGQWARAAELFHRYYTEATTGPAISLEKATFLEADCYYQLRQGDKALALYEDALNKHPFNPLAPEARLRLYHLDMMKNEPGKAQQELEALVWTVRTVWPKDEAYWQKQTVQLLMAVHKDDVTVLPPLLHEATKLSPEGKTWQESLDHYDALVGYEAAATQGSTEGQKATDVRHRLREDNDLLALDHNLNQILPPPNDP